MKYLIGSLAVFQAVAGWLKVGSDMELATLHLAVSMCCIGLLAVMAEQK